MPEDELKKTLHNEVLVLWEQYKSLQKTILVIQADCKELEKDISDCGKRIYELYQKSDEGLDS